MTYFNLLNSPKTGSPAEFHPAEDWARLSRFLIAGSEDGVYFTGERQPIPATLGSVKACLRLDGLRVVRLIVELAASGHVPDQQPLLQALALASTSSFGNPLTNAAALAALPQVARTASDLCAFAALVTEVRGWGRGLRNAIADWYLNKSAAELAYQVMKDEGTSQWTHADLLRLSHPKAETQAQNAVFQWVAEGALGHLATAGIRHGELSQVYAFEQVRSATSEGEVVRWIEDQRLSEEMIPSEWKRSARVWEALLENMPYRVMVSRLGKMTEVGLLGPHSTAAALVVARLMDRKRVAYAKVHPITLLAALIEYQRIHGIGNIVEALEDAFYLALDNVEPTGHRLQLTVDSAASQPMVAALLMTIVRSDTKASLFGLEIGAKDRLEDVCRAIADLPRQPDGPAAGIDRARQQAIPVDAFVFLAGELDGENSSSASAALYRYRQSIGVPAKLVVAGTIAACCQCVDRADVGQLGIAGLDDTVPGVIAAFVRS